MRNIFKKDQILTIPNLLSLARLAMIPLIIWLYAAEQNYPMALLMLFISWLTDVADGFIARRFNMISDFGKIFDPVADKLTQAAMLFCLAIKYKRMKYLIGIFAVKEIIVGIMGLFVIRKTDEIRGAVWSGKINTGLIYLTIGLLIIMPNMDIRYANGLISICCFSMIVSAGDYIRNYTKILK
ncbi:MAG: CDP-alcohol phosphatidyltransferase family protein [Clostridia bacterium]|nr:CDP-alcohol phosphatidyltransferase family protein [Clostridia bacterium]